MHVRTAIAVGVGAAIGIALAPYPAGSACRAQSRRSRPHTCSGGPRPRTCPA